MAITTQNLLSDAIRHHGAGNLQMADQLYRKILSQHPKQPEALHYLGVIALQSGQFDVAIGLIQQATVELPDYIDAYSNLGNALQAAGRLSEAAESFEKALSLKPNQAEVRANLGNVLCQMQNFRLAVNEYQSALALNPTLHETYRNLAGAQLYLGRTTDALESINKARELNPRSLEILLSAGNILHELGRVEEAVDCFKSVLLAKPDFPQVLCNLGNALREMGKMDEAILQYEKALSLDPDCIEGHYSRGIAFQEEGDLTSATKSFRHAISLNANHGKAHRSLASLVKHIEYDDDMSAMENVVDDANEEDRMHIAFGLGKSFEEIKQYEKAFDYYEIANSLKRQSIDYNVEDEAQLFTNLKEMFTSETPSPDKPAAGTQVGPLFIVGMPRSGTTLVEQILASHSQVYGGGELNALPRCIAGQMEMKGGVDYTDSLDLNDDATLQSIADQYLSTIGSLSPGSNRITDKLPMNFLNIGIIKRLFPDATIIHCQRSPVDTCLSIFKNLFSASGHYYAYDLKELAQYYNYYADLMDHWRLVFPDGFYEVYYESLVSNQEEESKKLINACGLSWEPACLDFHKTVRQVSTISATQVRKPMYGDSVKLWHHYESRLKPLTDLLNLSLR